MEGVLLKQSSLMRLRLWKERYFVLQGSTLSYRRPSSGESPGPRGPVGALALTGARVLDVRDSIGAETSAPNAVVVPMMYTAAMLKYKGALGKRPKGNTYLFAIETRERILWLCAPSVAEKQKWILALEQSIRRCAVPSEEEPPPVDQAQFWEVPLDYLVFGDCVMDGKYGQVYKGKVWGTQVAIKKLRIDIDHAGAVLRDLENEVDILARLRHPNVVLYIGASTTVPNVCIVTEWCDGGSLYDLLFDETRIVTFLMMIHIAIDVAQGMNYLHNVDAFIIHRDLKSQNILIDRKMTAKVADFGLSYKQGDSKVEYERLKEQRQPRKSLGVIGTPEFMAPEVMLGQPYDHKVDVYSYGVLLCELFGRMIPFSEQYTFDGYMDVFDAVLDDAAVPFIPHWIGPTLRALILACLDRDPSNRPEFASIISQLRRLLATHSTADIVSQFELPRILDLVSSPSEARVLRGLKNVTRLFRDGDRSICALCGYAAFGSEGTVLAADRTRVSMVLVAIVALFASDAEVLVHESLVTFLHILEAAPNSALRDTCLELLREEDCFETLFDLLSSDTVSNEVKESVCDLLLLVSAFFGTQELLALFGTNSTAADVFAAYASSSLRALQTEESRIQSDIDHRDRLVHAMETLR